MVAYSRPVENRYELVFKKSEKEIAITSIKDVIKYLKVGDILTVDGHTVLLYKTINESEAIYIESAHGIGKDVVNTKINKNGNHNLYLNEKINPDFKENITQGSVGICYLSTYTKWININNTLNYTILRFIHEDKAGNAILKYKTPLFDEDKAKNITIISLSPTNLARIKFKHLFIEKMVDKINNNIVDKSENLTYKIRVKNAGDNDYSYNLYVLEKLSEKVEYINTKYD